MNLTGKSASPYMQTTDRQEKEMKTEREQNEVCGTCKYHCHANLDNDWVCENEDSEYYADWTEYNDSCEDWEGRR